MKSTGNQSVGTVENGTIPASSQTFPTSFIRSTVLLHFYIIFTSSIQGLWENSHQIYPSPRKREIQAHLFPLLLQSCHTCTHRLGEPNPNSDSFLRLTNRACSSTNPILFPSQRRKPLYFLATTTICCRKVSPESSGLSMAIYHSSATFQLVQCHNANNLDNDVCNVRFSASSVRSLDNRE